MNEAGDTIIARCTERGLTLTGAQRVLAALLEEADDHPDVEEFHRRATLRDPKISLSTVYRTLRLLHEAGIVETLTFEDGLTRYEDAEREHHDHLIDVTTGQIIEFVDPEIEALQQKIADRLGYRLQGHRMELYAVPKDKDG